MIKRKRKKIIKIGNLKIGGDFPVLVQSMTNTDTKDVKKTIKQIKELETVGCEIIRVAVPDIESAMAIKKIKSNIKIPLVADIHFDWRLAVESILQGADKIRINPGNIGDKNGVKKIIDAARFKKIPIRIGINNGSLEKDLLKKYHNKPIYGALVESALRSVSLLEKFNFFDIVVSLKSSDVLTMVKAYEILSKKINYPLHLGVTEAGTVKVGTIKSSIGIGSLLLSGIGDTIRVSLSADPCEEIKAGWEILKSLKIRERGLNIVSCPTCARTQLPVEEIAHYVESFSEDSKKPFKIAIMGCVVNGIGEAKESDLAVVGISKEKAAIFKKGRFLKNIKREDIKKYLKGSL